MSNNAEGRRWKRLGPEARREQIREAARRLFEKSGYDAVSMGDVAEAAGVTRGLVHHYFRSKRELYLEVVQSVLAKAPKLATAETAETLDAMVQHNAALVLDYLSANRGMLLAIAPSGDLGRDPEVAALADAARETAIDQVIVNHLGDAEPPPEVRLVIRSFFGLVEAACREWLFRRRATRPQVEALLTQTILALMQDALPAVVAAGKASSKAA
jgi:AcrR family transcriptional regulator